MSANAFFRILLVPALLMALAGAIALAEQQTQPADSAPVASTGMTENDSTTSAPASESVQPSDAVPTDITAPSVPSKKKRGHEKVAPPVLDPVGEGKMLFETRCATCHSVPRPNTHTMSEWPECLNRMAPRSFLRDSDVKLMIQYLGHELKPQSDEPDEKEG